MLNAIIILTVFQDLVSCCDAGKRNKYYKSVTLKPQKVLGLFVLHLSKSTPPLAQQLLPQTLIHSRSFNAHIITQGVTKTVQDVFISYYQAYLCQKEVHFYKLEQKKKIRLHFRSSNRYFHKWFIMTCCPLLLCLKLQDQQRMAWLGSNIHTKS